MAYYFKEQEGGLTFALFSVTHVSTHTLVCIHLRKLHEQGYLSENFREVNKKKEKPI